MAFAPDTTVSISLTVKDGRRALEFYTAALGAKQEFMMPAPDGGVAHAEFSIGDTRIYLSDEYEEWQARAMPENQMSSTLLAIATDDCDASYRQALAAGATPLGEPQDRFWGRRTALVLDPFGYRWSFSQKLEDLSPEEITERAKAMFGE